MDRLLVVDRISANRDARTAELDKAEQVFKNLAGVTA